MKMWWSSIKPISIVLWVVIVALVIWAHMAENKKVKK